MKMNRKHILCSLLLTLAATLSGTAETLRVGYNNWVGYIGFFVAQEAGYFADAGLTVEGKSFGAPGEGIVPLINGNLDILLTTIDSVILKSDKMPGALKVVYLNDTSSGADALIGGAGITSVADLKGKKVGVTVGECNHLLLVKALEKSGLTEDDVQLANLDPDAAGAALKAGAVDAAVTWEPWISQVIGDNGGAVLFSTRDVPNLILDCIAVADAATTKKEAVTKFVAAVNKGNEFAISNPEKAAAMVEDIVEIPADEIVLILNDITLYSAEDNLNQMEGDAVEAAANIAVFFTERGMIAEDMDVANLFDSSFIPR